MKALALWVVSYLANSLWMIPLVFVAAWAATAIAQKLGPRIVHRIWITALMTEVLLPALHLRLPNGDSILRALGMLGTVDPSSRRTTAAITMGSVYAHGALILPRSVLIATVVIYAGTLMYFIARLIWSLWKTHVIASKSSEVSEEVELRWQVVTKSFDLAAGIAQSEDIPGPVTVGMRKGLLLLPEGFADRTTGEDLEAVMAHECAHMVRHDFTKNLFYSAISLPCAFHPFLWMTRSKVSESREMICDAVAAERFEGPKSYARSLLRLASLMIERTPANIHAIGIFDANHLERRIMRLTRRSANTGRLVRGLMLAACGVIGLATWASALTLRTEVGAEVTSAAGQEKQEGQADLTMPVLIHSEIPNYPSTGKNDHINGTCLVSLTVNEQGIPTHVHIVRSLRADFDESALKAVRGYRFEPALRQGKPVAREIKVEVRFAYF